MSISINVNGMNYNELSCAQRAVIDAKRKNRITQVNVHLFTFVDFHIIDFSHTSRVLL